MPSVTAEEATVRYATNGNGPGLLLVSGTGLDAQTNWGQLAPRFAQRHTVVLADYAGSGDTPLPDGQLSVDLLAGQMAAVAAAAADQPVDLLGYSLGAMVAATVAATRPELVRHLVLVAGWPSPDDARQQLAFDLWRRLERTDHDVFNRFLQLTCLSAPFLSAIGAEGVAGLIAGAPPITDGMRAHIELDGRADIRDLLPKITAPTLVIGLSRDQVIPVQQARQVHEAIPGSQLAEIDSDHLVVFERPDELVGIVESFLADDSS